MKLKQISVVVSFLLLLTVLAATALILPDREISASERRYLLQLESYEKLKVNAEKAGGEYGISDYFAYLEKYSLDQFPARDTFRSIKSLFKKYLLFSRDNNGYYLADGTLCKLDKELDTDALNGAIARFNGIYREYFKVINANAYYSIVPDKNYFVAEKNGYLHYDYQKMFASVAEGLDQSIKEIDIKPILSINDYYITDPHWEQSRLLPAADALLDGMNNGEQVSKYSWTKTEYAPFYGTYYGQAALPVGGEKLYCLNAAELDGVTVFDYAKNKTVKLYDEENFKNTDPYDIFLGGAVPLLKITNPNCKNGKQLVIFRDSFGSSIVPLLAGGYSEVIVADIRYITPGYIRQTVRFKPGCDLLFLYSSSVLNSYGVFAQ